MGLAVQVSAKDCERKAINANLCLVVAALSVTGAHHRTIEQFISIILSRCRFQVGGLQDANVNNLADGLIAIVGTASGWMRMECDNKEGMRDRAHAKTRGDKNAQQLSKYPAWRAKALRGLRRTVRSHPALFVPNSPC